MQSDNAWDRMRALRALDKVSDRNVAMAFALAQLEQTEGRGRFMAIEALVELGGPEAVAALTGLLREDGNDWMQGRITRALAELGDTSALPALREIYTQSNGRNQIATAMAMRDLGDSSAVTEIGQQAVTEFASSDGGVRLDAVRTLSTLRDVSYNPTLVQALGDTNSDVRLTALRTLARQGTASELPAVMNLLSDPREEVARTAQRTIELIQNPEMRNDRRSMRFIGGDFGGRGGRGR
jgi:HEAT repeat protein